MCSLSASANGTVLAGTFEVERLTSFDPFGVPAGAEELDELNIPGVIDFNPPVSSENLFAKTKAKSSR